VGKDKNQKKEGIMARTFQKSLLLSMLVAFLAFGISTQAIAGEKANYHFKCRLSQVMPVNSDHDKRCEAFAKEVKEKTDGRVDIKVYSGGVLGDWVDIYEYVMRGGVDMAMQPIAPTYDPRLNIAYYVPYLFTNTKEAKEAYEVGGWVYNMVENLLNAQGIKGLALYPSGWAGMTATKAPEGWEDMKPNGMKIRVMPIKACEMTWKTLGYIPSTIPYNEAYSAIERGVAQGESGGPPFQGYQFRDVQGVWIQYNDFLEPWWFFMNLKEWNQLTKDDQQVIIDAAKEQVDGRWDYFLKEDQEYRDKMKDYGMKVIVPSDDQLKAFAQKVRTVVWPELDQVVGKSLMDICRKHAGMAIK
jgi:TRAP-type C4-dicarboxylate transport system substrate-binding protein